MKLFKQFSIILLLFNVTNASAQTDSTRSSKINLNSNKLTFEPGIGLAPMSDLVVSNLIQYNIAKRLSIVSYTSCYFNNALEMKFNYIETNYNYSLSQKFGIGTMRYTKHSTHTLSFMAGIRYDTFKETLNNPEFEKVTVSTTSTTPDFGLLYNIKVGQKKYFFSFRTYLPLWPYPFKSTEINAVDGNVGNMSLEVGVGVRM